MFTKHVVYDIFAGLGARFKQVDHQYSDRLLLFKYRGLNRLRDVPGQYWRPVVKMGLIIELRVKYPSKKCHNKKINSL